MLTSKNHKTDTEELKKLQKNEKIRNDVLDVKPKKILTYPLINQN